MFEIELKNPDVMLIREKNNEVAIDLANSAIDAGLEVGKIEGAGEFEIGDMQIVAVALKESKGVLYRIKIDDIRIGLVDGRAKSEDLDELGPVDILGSTEAKFVPMVEPKIVVPMGNMDFAELKGEVKAEKRLKIKNASAIPQIMEIWRLG